MVKGSALKTRASQGWWAPSSVRTPQTRAPSRRTSRTGELVEIVAPAAVAARSRRDVRVPMPPRRIIQVPSAPGRRHMLWIRKFMPVPGVSQPPVRPEKPSVTAYMALRRSL